MERSKVASCLGVAALARSWRFPCNPIWSGPFGKWAEGMEVVEEIEALIGWLGLLAEGWGDWSVDWDARDEERSKEINIWSCACESMREWIPPFPLYFITFGIIVVRTFMVILVWYFVFLFEWVVVFLRGWSGCLSLWSDEGRKEEVRWAEDSKIRGTRLIRGGWIGGGISCFVLLDVLPWLTMRMEDFCCSVLGIGGRGWRRGESSFIHCIWRMDTVAGWIDWWLVSFSPYICPPYTFLYIFARIKLIGPTEYLLLQRPCNLSLLLGHSPSSACTASPASTYI